MTTIWTRSELISLITVWKKAYAAAASGKSYTIGGRSLTRQNLSEIRSQLDYLQKELASLDGRRGPTFVIGRVRR